MKRCWLAVAWVLVGSLAASAQEPPRKPALAHPVQVVVEVCQVEVNVRGLRRMGVDWKAATENEKIAGNPAWLRKWVELLIENDLAKMHANPILTTLAGRQAAFHVGGTRETIRPEVADGKIAVAVTLETYGPRTEEEQKADPEALGPLRTSLSTKVTCQPGETVLLGHDLSKKNDSEGNVTGETAMLTFLKADLVKPELKQAQKGKAPELRPVDRPLVGTRPLGSIVEIPEKAPPRRR